MHPPGCVASSSDQFGVRTVDRVCSIVTKDSIVTLDTLSYTPACHFGYQWWKSVKILTLLEARFYPGALSPAALVCSMGSTMFMLPAASVSRLFVARSSLCVLCVSVCCEVCMQSNHLHHGCVVVDAEAARPWERGRSGCVKAIRQ